MCAVRAGHRRRRPIRRARLWSTGLKLLSRLTLVATLRGRVLHGQMMLLAGHGLLLLLLLRVRVRCRLLSCLQLQSLALCVRLLHLHMWRQIYMRGPASHCSNLLLTQSLAHDVHTHRCVAVHLLLLHLLMHTLTEHSLL